MSLRLGQLKVCEVVAARQDAGQQLTQGKNKQSVVIVPSAVAAPLVRMLCPALDALMALEPATTQRLQSLHFVPPGDALLSGWEAGLNLQVPDAQLMSIGGVTYALAGVKCSSFKDAVVKVLHRTAAASGGGGQVAPSAALPAAAAAWGQVGNISSGLCGFFWGVHALLRTEVVLGVTSRKSSQALAAQIVDEYVHGVAHVANLLVALHNLLLRGGPLLEHPQRA